MHDLNVYAEQELLGMGGFAEVVRALHIVTRDVVALKKSRPAPECVARTKREIELQSLLLHANIMPICDWATDGSWFVMPVSRGDLGEIHEREPLRAAAILRLVEDVGAALAAAHRRGYVHRDVKPANIQWLSDRWVVADWGFVKLPPGAPRTRLTGTGVGSECFTAPEVYRDGNTATPAADIYSLGRVVGWVLLGLTEPGKPIPVEPESPWFRFVTKTTSEDPAERPQSVDEAIRLLAPAFDQFSDSAPSLPMPSAATFDVEAAAVSSFKVLLQDPSRAIQLDELIEGETEACFARLTPEAFPVQKLEQGAELEARLQRYAQSCSLLMKLLVTGCAYGADIQAQMWTRAVRRIGYPSGEWGGSTAMLGLRYFPTTLLMYAAGLASLSREQWANFAAVTTAPRLPKQGGEDEQPAALRAAAATIMGQDHGRTLPGLDRHHTPTSDWLFKFLREPLRQFYRINEDYERGFDRFEYLVSMAAADHRKEGWVPPGRFAWRSAERRRYKQPTIGDELRAEIASFGVQWGPVRGGVFRDANDAMVALEWVERAISARNWI